MERAGRSDAPILLLGETGTGKEVAARAIHAVSGRGAYVPIDCSALAGPLMESELFGYTRGAFTGAMNVKRGLIEAASGGTAFFDEVGELPLDHQAKLLRLLQEKEYRPLGTTDARKADFRVIAATNRDLAREVNNGRFRSDLYYRLRVITLRLAPLRERKDDIPLIAEHFMKRYAPGRILAPEVIRAFCRYHWPGNVRELENCVLAMTALSCGGEVGLADLPVEFVEALSTAPPWNEQHGSPRGGNASNRETLPEVPLAEIERMAIVQALGRANGDRGLAAAMLQVGRTTLYRKLKEYGVEATARPRKTRWAPPPDSVHTPSSSASMPRSLVVLGRVPLLPLSARAFMPSQLWRTLLVLEPIEFATPHRLRMPTLSSVKALAAAAMSPSSA